VSENRIAIRRSRLPGTPGAFAVEQRATSAVVGLVTVEPGSPRGGTEVSYTLLPEVWGRGLGREAVAEVIRWARDLPGTQSMAAVTQSANVSSRSLLEAVGVLPGDELVEYGKRQTIHRLPVWLPPGPTPVSRFVRVRGGTRPGPPRP
jgi:RimJ/RimL family protein N-acetyltransferase